MSRLAAVPAPVRLVYLPLVLTVCMVVFLFSFNRVVIERRLQELSYLLETVARSQDQNKSLELLAKYATLKERARGAAEQEKDAMQEAKLKFITEDAAPAGQPVARENVMTFLADRAIGALRFLMGKNPQVQVSGRQENRAMYLGYMEERARNYDQAISQYLKVLHDEQVPHNEKLFAMLHLGYCYSFTNEMEQAEKYYRTVLAEGEGQEGARVAATLLSWVTEVLRKNREIEAEKSMLAKAKKYYQYMDYKNAIQNFTAVIAHDAKQRTEATYNRGRAFEESGQADKAINDYETVIKNDKETEWAKQANRRLYTISSVYRKDADGTQQAKERMKELKDQGMLEAVSELDKITQKAAVETDASIAMKEAQGKVSADDYLRYANEYMEARQYDQAIINYEKAIKENPRFADAYSNLGILYKRQNKLDDAERQFRMALTVNPRHEAAQTNLTNLLRRKGDYEKIETQSRQAAEQGSGKSAMAYHATGMAYLDKEQLDKAIAEFKKAIQQAPDMPEIQSSLGVAYYRKREYANAVVYLRKAATNLAYANRDRASFNLGLAYQQNREYTKAIEAYKDVLMSDPSMTEAKENLVSCYIDAIKANTASQNYEGMISAYKGVLKYKPETPGAKKNLAVTYSDYGVKLMDKKKYDAAIEKLTAALELDPGLAIAKENLAVAYLSKGVELSGQGDTKGAIIQFNKAAAAAPGSEAAQMAKQNIQALKGQ
jgi:tetratricopeptide (TPR) repeat protein